MVVIAILGLLVPGYVLARALRSPVPWAIAFPLSALLLAQIVIAYTLLGIPIRFEYVFDAVIIVIYYLLGGRSSPHGGNGTNADRHRAAGYF